MTNEKMEQRLAAALEKTAPDDMSGVLSLSDFHSRIAIIFNKNNYLLSNSVFTNFLNSSNDKFFKPASFL